MQDVHGIIQFLWLLHLHRWCVHIHHCYLQMAAMTFLRGFVNDHVVIECLKGMEYDGRIMTFRASKWINNENRVDSVYVTA